MKNIRIKIMHVHEKSVSWYTLPHYRVVKKNLNDEIFPIISCYSIYTNLINFNSDNLNEKSKNKN